MLHVNTDTGEVRMLAVDPAHQRRGVATALLTVAVDWIRTQGRATALISTGGDSGHAPARAAYESMGFTAMSTVSYWKKL